MRPTYSKTQKKVKCILRKNKSRNTKIFGYNKRIASDLDNINQVLNKHLKSKRAKGRGSWKVVPKDSCEVYKNRNRRQIENQNKDCEKDSTSNQKNQTGGECRCSHKQRDDSSRSSYTSYSDSETSCSCLTDSDK